MIKKSALSSLNLQMLKKLGYRADAVANGDEAIQALERQPYDLILMDIKMPVLGGIEATRMIRERWLDNGPKIVAIIAYALHGDKERCLAVGMDGYIPKPVQKEDLAEVLKRYPLMIQQRGVGIHIICNSPHSLSLCFDP